MVAPTAPSSVLATKLKPFCSSESKKRVPGVLFPAYDVVDWKVIPATFAESLVTFANVTLSVVLTD